MRRSWPTILTIVALAVLFAVLSFFQYRWLTQISEANGEKARTRVKEQTDRFAADFNREIQNGYFNFQLPADKWRTKDWPAFKERYDYWQRNSAYPNLITDIYFFENSPGSRTLQYDKTTGTFDVTVETVETERFRSLTADEKTFKAVDIANLTLLLPIHDIFEKRIRSFATMPDKSEPKSIEMPKRFGYLAIKLEPNVLKDGVLADLNAKYFGDGEYAIGVSDNDGNVLYRGIVGENADAKAGLFDLKPDNMIFFSNRDTVSALNGEKQISTVISSKIESHSFNRVEGGGDGGDVKIEVKRSGDPGRTSIYTATTAGDMRGPLTLMVQHSSGSLDGYIASSLRRDLALGFGILFLLAAAIAAIIISSLRAKRLAQRQMDFVSSVSHEFRTPLAVIYSAGENLADGVTKGSQQVTRYGEMIKSEGRKLSDMVEQILGFAGSDSGRHKYTFTAADVGEIVDAAIRECSPAIESRGFVVEKDIASSLPTVSGDSIAIKQAIQNLILNSIKYTEDGKWIRVSAENGNSTVKISVEDRGIGISKGDLKHIFEPFFRSRSVVDAQIHGNGLGLSIVKQIAEAHGGRVFAESEIGHGSKFTIELRSKPIASDG